MFNVISFTHKDGSYIAIVVDFSSSQDPWDCMTISAFNCEHLSQFPPSGFRDPSCEINYLLLSLPLREMHIYTSHIFQI